MTPKATTAISAAFTLDSRSVTPAQTPFNPNNSNTYNYSNALGPIYDSLGNPHELGAYFVKVPALNNTWDVYGTIDGNPVSTPSAPMQRYVFDTNGTLTTPASGTFTVPTLTFTNGSAPINTTVNLTGTTQVGNPNAINALKQDGYTSGQLTAFSINPDGTITGTYSNEKTQLLGQVVLSSF
ncbi:MAG: flagellar hook-basal body complex protein, partial [Comamonadaceae bacterium]